MQLLNTIIFCAALVSATPRIFGRTNSINQVVPRSTLVLDKSLPRMSDAEVMAIYQTCWPGKLVWPQNDLPTPAKDQAAKQLQIYSPPETKPGMLTVNNYCNYPIHYVHLGGSGGEGVLAPKGTFETPLTGTVFKASQTANLEKVVLLEYVVSNSQLWYDLSLIECLGKTNGYQNTDTSQCVGFEAGLQLGNKEHFSFQCRPGTWCDDQAYFYQVSCYLRSRGIDADSMTQENECKKAHPNTVCDPAMGITAEFCAANKK
jgi:hypothetical protein